MRYPNMSLLFALANPRATMTRRFQVGERPTPFLPLSPRMKKKDLCLQ